MPPSRDQDRQDKGSVSPRLPFGYEVSKSAPLSAKQATAAHCKVIFWLPLTALTKTNRWIPQLHPGLRVKRLLLFTIKSYLRFYDKTLASCGIFHPAFLCMRPEATELPLRTYRSYKETFKEFNSTISSLLPRKYNSKLCKAFSFRNL